MIKDNTSLIWIMMKFFKRLELVLRDVIKLLNQDLEAYKEAKYLVKLARKFRLENSKPIYDYKLVKSRNTK